MNKTYGNAKMVFADPEGNLYDHPHLEMVGFSADKPVRVEKPELIALPRFSKLFYLPKCRPIGFDPSTGKFVTLEKVKVGRKTIFCCGVGAFLEPGYARTLLPAIDYGPKDYILPLWAYTAVGWAEGGFVAAAFRVESNHRWDPRAFDDRRLISRMKTMMKKYNKNPLFAHLRRCALDYHCFAAKNLFFRRWEAPLPVSSTCNARCMGCLSDQPPGSCPASHNRISFTPEPIDVAHLAVDHLGEAEDPIVSFGQGCEGEPLLEHRLISEAIRLTREKTDRGTINLNSNGSMPDRVTEIVSSGLDSVRITVPSARPRLFNAYCRPNGYGLEEVLRSASICREKGVFTMINYLIFPGISDQLEEIEQLFVFIRKSGAQFIHFKNLNIDPELYLRRMSRGDSHAVGIRRLYELLKEEFPHLEIGYFNKNIKAPS